ncbi:2-(3-amino-3-carboxypropyl)histidine synthase [Pancytospora epiphaga]|nr:2-(3-amino-3-carboxypropyl)histidine synthase [Pancytospora epiphaga]
MVVILENQPSFPNTVPGLPENYNFELRKTLSMINKLNARRVALQFPDGLLCYAPILIDTIQTNTGAECFIINDVVYGACCIDDKAIPADLLLHYGHSCLIPVTEMCVRVLYIFVDIRIDIDHLKMLITTHFQEPVAIIGTIQFNSSVNRLKKLLNQDKEAKGAIVPQIKPLSPGEVLGCTSPLIKDVNTVVYIGDGRFHLESAMIRNPLLNFYKYCPFTRKMTKETYDYEEMIRIRKAEISRALNGRKIGVILGSLGRQGNKVIMDNVISKLKSKNFQIYRIVVDEINESILDRFDFIDAFVQISCPRLSIDWGACYRKPLLSPFELFYDGEYQMDYYSSEGSAPWKNYNNRQHSL